LGHVPFDETLSVQLCLCFSRLCRRVGSPHERSREGWVALPPHSNLVLAILSPDRRYRDLSVPGVCSDRPFGFERLISLPPKWLEWHSKEELIASVFAAPVPVRDDARERHGRVRTGRPQVFEVTGVSGTAADLARAIGL
jgi:hypothetical protein